MDIETAKVKEDGFALVPAMLSSPEVGRLCTALMDYAEQANNASRRDGSIFGLRNLMEGLPLIGEVAHFPSIRNAIEPLLGRQAFVARALFFDKTPEANWPVPYHQDRTITVQERVEVEGFGPWSEKGGIVHVQPPAMVLEKMVALRLHLDDCGPTNGPLRVLPGTHRLGKLEADRIQQLRREIPEVSCLASSGDGLLIRPLLLHASGAVIGEWPHRRVLHLEWAAHELPGGLRWRSREEQ